MRPHLGPAQDEDRERLLAMDRATFDPIDDRPTRSELEAERHLDAYSWRLTAEENANLTARLVALQGTP